jgi:hypothetical protein
MVSIPTLALAIASTGGGHGTYFMARLLFPLTMLSTWLFGSITNPLIVAAVLQFPVYGFVIGRGFGQGRAIKPILIVLFIHVFLAVFAFVVREPYFNEARAHLTRRSTRTQQRLAAVLSHGHASSSPLILRSAAGPVNFDR